jgi:ArsR family transcriptional regulator
VEIINILREKELTVSEITKEMGISIGSLSQHLIMMKLRGVLDSRKEGNNVYYFLANPKMLKAFDIIREVLCEQIEMNNKIVRMSKGFDPNEEE